MPALRYIAFVLLASCLLTRTAKGQGLLIRNYNVKDGLTNATVNAVVQDMDGFIWFATPTGVSRFDGKRFRNYAKKDGLPDNEVIKLAADSKNRVWFFTYSGKLSFYSNNYIHNENNDSSLVYDSRGFHMLYAFEEKSKMTWFHTSANKVSRYNGRKTVHDDRLGVVDLFYWLKMDTLFKPLQQYFPLSSLLELNERSPEVSVHAYYGNMDREFSNRVKSHPVLILGNDLYTYNAKAITPFLRGRDMGIRDEISSVCIDRDNLWIGTQRALYVIRNYFKGETRISKLLENHYVTSILSDRDGNIWITTYGDGVYYIPNKNFYFSYLDNTNGLYSHSVFSVFKNGKVSDLLLIGQNAGILTTMDNRGNTRQLSLDSTGGRNSVLNMIPAANKSDVLINTDNAVYSFDLLSQKIRLLQSIRAVRDIDVSTTGKIRIATYNRIITLPANTQEIAPADILITSLASLGDSAYYVGTNNGLYIGKENEPFVSLKDNDSLLRHSIKDLKLVNGKLWIGTSDNGICVMENRKVIKQFTTRDNLTSDICQQLYYDGGNRLYVATNKGVSVLNTNTMEHIGNITSNDGLNSDDVRNLCKSGDTLFIATSNGLCYFNEDNIPVDSIPPKIYLNAIRYGDSTYYITDNSFEHLFERKGSFEVEFGAIAFDQPDLVEYQYNFSNDTARGWVTTMSNIIPYPNLQPGHYQLLIRARKFKSNWGEPITLSISIQPQWYQEWWARGILFVLGLLVITLALRFVISKIKASEKRKTEYNRRIAELEAKALTNQMNPHFIFNSLNSVQHLILEKEEKQALNFLADFATLMRQMLNNSRKSYLSLDDEIAFLTRYLELEKIRFASSFVYHFEIEPALKEHTVYIPPMLIQPILENAIKHGLAPKNGNGNLLVRLWMKEDLLYCTVDDDGIGWERSNSIKSGKLMKHESTALSVIKERLQIIKSFNGSVGKLEIIDKFNSGFSNKEGTLVEILIPIVKML
ncbi:sensor histidine kinase [Chitinophaga skermanii]|nr:sensor histidine kinase [Chitinophaga skermanii]